MDFGQVDDFDVIGGFVVLDLAAGPIHAFDAELVARVDGGDHGNIRVPPIVQNIVLLRRFTHVHLDQGLHSVPVLVLEDSRDRPFANKVPSEAAFEGTAPRLRAFWLLNCFDRVNAEVTIDDGAMKSPINIMQTVGRCASRNFPATCRRYHDARTIDVVQVARGRGVPCAF
jgi:hypothetical protein